MLKIPSKIEYVINTLYQNGFEAYIVGGCVRDMLLGGTPHDFDITTSATPQQIQSLFEKTVPTGIKHGTVTVIIDSIPIEVTTFRKESEYIDHRRPQTVEFVASLREDLSRRDFTVNAFAYNHETGIIDYFGGKQDLEAKILRAVGEPEKRFNEDALRILRLFRFSSVLGFRFEENTLNAAIKYAPSLKQISSERIFSELYKAASGKNPRAMAPLIKSGGLEFLGVVKEPDYTAITRLNSKPDLAIFAFLYLSGAEVLKTLQQLKVSNKLKNYCKDLLELLKLPLPETKPQIKEMLCCGSPEIVADMLDFRKAVYGTDAASAKKSLTEILENNEPYLISHLEIDGEKIMQLGICGKEIGKILSHLQTIVIEHPQKNKSEILTEEINKFHRN